MLYRRCSVFCRIWLNNKTLTHAVFLTHTKMSTHATHAKILWIHATHATHAKIWPMPAMHLCYSHHPRDLADSINIIIFAVNHVFLYGIFFLLNPIQWIFCSLLTSLPVFFFFFFFFFEGTSMKVKQSCIFCVMPSYTLCKSWFSC